MKIRIALVCLLTLGTGLVLSGRLIAQAVHITHGPVIETASSNSAVIAWSTNESSNSRVWYGTDKNNLTRLGEARYGGNTHRVELTNLKPGTTYYFEVESGQAKGGSEAESQGVLSFQTVAAGAPAVHNQKPVLAEKGLANEENGKVKITHGPVLEHVDAHSATVAWSTNLKGSTRVDYGTDPNNLTQLAEAPWGQGGLTHRVTIRDLKPNTTYYFNVETGQAQGTGGAEVDSSKVMSFKTSGEAPTQAKNSPKKK
ncbi:MAG TPA: fibronectin type III domain-containing protein [Terriglobales bacterium]|nr:fibronectin type III domain-containing protein [Terriglobales bacterium]